MDIIVGGISSVKNDLVSEENVTSTPSKNMVRKDRRKNKRDRRRGVREGIFVSLSTKEDRRVLRDRRKNPA